MKIRPKLFKPNFIILVGPDSVREHEKLVGSGSELLVRSSPVRGPVVFATEKLFRSLDPCAKKFFASGPTDWTGPIRTDGPATPAYDSMTLRIHSNESKNPIFFKLKKSEQKKMG